MAGVSGAPSRIARVSPECRKTWSAYGQFKMGCRNTWNPPSDGGGVCLDSVSRLSFFPARHERPHGNVELELVQSQERKLIDGEASGAALAIRRRFPTTRDE
jgi:hypothetical protein